MSIKNKISILGLIQLAFAITLAFIDLEPVLSYMILIIWALILEINIKFLKKYRKEERN
ncbi:hypothetical protein R2F61_05120 [Mollicutes bacterium LVI A0078]|nr:hypothetical protein RZE84_05140 [Mollicutes bacterium LVI A0075]WOO90109.1 hypothetical protein R2F61_05120 [Mollicutes bacterium LVI A0078]